MTFNRRDRIEQGMAYLDYNSTTLVDSRVMELMVQIFNRQFGNPSSVSYSTGRTAEGLVSAYGFSVRSLAWQRRGLGGSCCRILPTVALRDTCFFACVVGSVLPSP